MMEDKEKERGGGLDVLVGCCAGPSLCDCGVLVVTKTTPIWFCLRHQDSVTFSKCNSYLLQMPSVISSKYWGGGQENYTEWS